MKKIIFIFLFSLVFSTFSFSQSTGTFKEEFRIAVGVNAIQDLETRKPFSDFDEWAFKTPISVGLEYQFAENWSLEQSFSFNKYNTAKDFMPEQTKDYTYFSTDTSVKYYLNKLIKSNKFDVFATGGLGVFNIDDLNTSANLGGGVLYWFNDTIGLRGTALGKFALNISDKVYENNHFQYKLELIIKL